MRHRIFNLFQAPNFFAELVNTLLSPRLGACTDVEQFFSRYLADAAVPVGPGAGIGDAEPVRGALEGTLDGLARRARADGVAHRGPHLLEHLSAVTMLMF